MVIVGETVKLDSLLNTQNDIKRREVLAIIEADKLKHLFLNKDVTFSVKAKLSRSFITPMFLYSSELWTQKTTCIANKGA